MTQPDGLMPVGAANETSFAAYAAKTQEDWESERRTAELDRWTRINTGLRGDIPTGMSINNWLAGIWSKVVTDVNTYIGIDLSSWDAFLASLEDGKGIDLPGLPQLVSDVDDTWKALVSGFAGLLSPETWGLPDVESAITGTAESIATNAANIAQMMATLQQNQNNGSLLLVDFSQLPDSTNLPAPLTQTYTGAGVKPYGVTSGRAYVDPSNGATADRATHAVHGGAQCATNLQMAFGIWTAIPGEDAFGNRGYAELACREDATGATRTWVRLYRSRAVFGCTVAGTETSFATKSFSFKSNTTYVYLCGTAGGQRVYEVREGSPAGRLVAATTEVGTTAQIGVGYLSCGLGAGWVESPFGNIGAGAMMYFGFADNSNSATVGSYFRAYRSNASLFGASTGNNALPADWYGGADGAIDRITPDFQYDSATNTLTFNGRKGTYSVTVSQRIADTTLSNAAIGLILAKNGVVVRRGGHVYQDSNLTGPVIACVTWQVYLQPGDTLVPGYNSLTAGGSLLAGESAGTDTYWEVALANNSTN